MQEYVQYILINKDVPMSAGKLAVQVGHVCTQCAVKEQDTQAFKAWYAGIQKKVVLGAKQCVLEALEQRSLSGEGNIYAIRDVGLTEVEPNSLTAVSLGVRYKGDVQDIVKRLQVFK